MNYGRIYREFIADRRKREAGLTGYTERHHVLPRSLGGGDEPDNLIRLTAEDHYFAHCCLAKMHGGKMWSALFAIAHMAKTDRAAAYFSKRRMVRAAREKGAKRRSENMRELWATGVFTRNRVYEPWSDDRRARHSAIFLGRTLPRESYERARSTRLASAPTFVFVHEDGRKFSGRAFDFRAVSGLSQSMVSFLTRGKIAWAKGWMLEGGNPDGARGRDPTIRHFRHKDGAEFIGTVRQFGIAYPRADCGSVSKMVNGKLGTVNGWRLIRATEPNVS